MFNIIYSPQVFTKESTRLQAPVVVGYFKQKQIRFQDLTKRRWRLGKPKFEWKADRFNVCRWYKKKRALKLQRDQQRREKEKEKRRKREEYERERINDLIRWENGKQQRLLKEEKKRKKREEQEKQRINDNLRLEYENQLKELKEDEKRRKREENERERRNDIIRSEFAKPQKNIVKQEPRLRFDPLEEKKRVVSFKEIKHKPNPWTSLRRKREENERVRSEFAKQHNEIVKQEPKLRFDPPEEKKKVVTIQEMIYRPKPWTSLKKKIIFPVQKKEKTKKIIIKEKSTSAKPRAQTKQVLVKKYKAKDSLTNRFVNGFYRVCCQCYCCLTCILFIALVLIVLF